MLPYVEAILRETFRWHPVTPFGIPRATTTSDVYNDYFIPKGVAVFPNTSKVLHAYSEFLQTTKLWGDDAQFKKYLSPDEFKPEIFLHEDRSLTSDTTSLVFRRIW